MTNTEVETLRVEALGGDRWRIREFEEPHLLRGRYLGGEALCTVRLLGRANRQRLEISLEIKQRDLVFNPKPGHFLGSFARSNTQDKLTKILMAKSLYNAMDPVRSFDGILVASVGSCADDDE